MTALPFRTATDVAAALARGELSAGEVTAAVLDRIAAVDPRLGAVAELDAAGAGERAATAGAAGPLAGVPMTVKEALAVAGLHASWGEPAFAGTVAAADATVVARLRAAGANVIGTSNVATMLGDFGQTTNAVYGRTRNPWDVDRVPGGSSGGAAAAVAAGLTYLEYGSDLVGSIRVPAALCGVYGLKPTAGIVPLEGFQPAGPPNPPTLLDHLTNLGPLARSAADLRTALRVTAGPSGAEALARRWTLPAPRHDRLRDFRVGIVLDDPAAPVTGEVGAVLSGVADAVAAAGATVVAGWPDGLDAAANAATYQVQLGAFFAFHGEPDGGPALAALLDAERERAAARAAWDAYFGRVDVLLCPATFTTAFAHDDRPFGERTIATSGGGRAYTDLAFWSLPASLAGLPALSAPAGRAADGLPVGVQVIGPRYEDDTVLTFAERLAEVVGGYEIPEGV